MNSQPTTHNPQPTPTPKLIVGLGNPGAKYEQTRHNIGFDAVDLLCDRWFCSWQNNRRFKGLFTEGRSPGGGKIYLLKPQTYMNRSGESVRAVIDWYKLTPEEILVIYDDMDLAVGRLRLRLSGSAGGHNGMKSIISHLGGQNFPRLRIGIDKSSPDKETVSHVLGKFAPQEKETVQQVLQWTTEAVELSLKEGVPKAMSFYNGKAVEAPQSS